MRFGERLLAIAIAGLIALTVGSPAPTRSQAIAQPQAVAPEEISIEATPIRSFQGGEPDRTRFGHLEFRGGIALTSDHANFGGISGLHVDPDGERFLALTDRAFWVRGRLLTDGGRPAGVADAEIAPLLGADGQPLGGRRVYDTESLAAGGGNLYVGVERTHRIIRFDYAKSGLSARAQPVSVPATFRDLPNNQGIEGLAFVPKGRPLAGTLIAISERGLDSAGNTLAFLIGGPTPGTFSIRRTNDFDLTDAALTPDGDLLVLERHFSWMRGVGMRIRRIPLSEIKPGATVDGTVLIEAGNSHQIDNMEALAAHKNAAGETILTIVSDDNFLRLQRTILLRFALIED